ncbi:hypothetical protein QNK12_14810 [Neobacillus cucumis]|nr:hypothetical protein QNK12_14810 [Neobacillus cucumis]
MRDLIENGFQTAAVYDATATINEKDFQAAFTNYQAFSSATWSTQQAICHLYYCSVTHPKKFYIIRKKI